MKGGCRLMEVREAKSIPFSDEPRKCIALDNLSILHT